MKIEQSLWPKFEVYLFVDRKMSSHTTSVYPLRCRFNKLVEWFTGREFDRDNVNLFIGEMSKNGSAPSYRNKMIVLCKHLDKFLKLNNLSDYTYFKESYQPKEILTPQEIEALASVVVPYSKDQEYVNQRQKALILLLGTTGSRIGEVLGLKWSDLMSTPPHIIYRETKNGDVRLVPIGQSIFGLLTSLPRRSDFIFSSYRMKVLGQPQLNLDFKRRARMVGITKPVYNHIFRHSYITTMLELGVDVSDVARIVGHKNLNSTMRYKNSLMAYYSEVVNLHPLLKHALSFHDLNVRIYDYLAKLVDSRIYDLDIQQGEACTQINIYNRVYNEGYEGIIN
jgi:site-specific recombinase XerD